MARSHVHYELVTEFSRRGCLRIALAAVEVGADLVAPHKFGDLLFVIIRMRPENADRFREMSRVKPMELCYRSADYYDPRIGKLRPIYASAEDEIADRPTEHFAANCNQLGMEEQ